MSERETTRFRKADFVFFGFGAGYLFGLYMAYMTGWTP